MSYFIRFYLEDMIQKSNDTISSFEKVIRIPFIKDKNLKKRRLLISNSKHERSFGHYKHGNTSQLNLKSG